MTPAWRSMASKASGGALDSRTSCPGGTPYSLTPLLTTMVGFTRASWRAMRENLRGLPTLSRYSPTTAVRSSSSQYCRASLPDTSARLPADRNERSPRPRRSALDSTATPSPPDWLNRARAPGLGRVGATEALRLTAGSVLMMPKLLGPITRIPLARARRTTSCWSSTPSSPSSANPLLTTTAPLTPRSTHWASTSGTEAAGTVTTARSTGPGTSDTEAWATEPPTSKASRLTTWTGPVNPPSVMACSTRAPKLEASAARPDHHDGTGVEQGPHAQRLRPVLARGHDGQGALGGVDVEGDLDDPVVEVVADLVAGLAEHPEHALVGRAGRRR